MRAWILMLAVLALAGHGLAAGEAPRNTNTAVGLIIDWRPPVYLLRAGQAQLAELARSNLFESLYSGDQLRCGTNGRLVTALRSGKAWVYSGIQWTNVSNVLNELRLPEPDPRMALWRDLMTAETVIGGRRRAARGIHCPADGGVVRAAAAGGIRWIPDRFSGKAAILLRDKASRNVLWRQTGVDGRSGRLDSNAYAAVLERQGKQQPWGELELEIKDADGNSCEVSFRVMPATQEAELDRELAVWDKEFSEVERLLERAFTFQRRQLFNEAAAAWDRAIDSDGGRGSLALLRQAILAHEGTGDYLRADELRRSLSAGPGGP